MSYQHIHFDDSFHVPALLQRIAAALLWIKTEHDATAAKETTTEISIKGKGGNRFLRIQSLEYIQKSTYLKSSLKDD